MKSLAIGVLVWNLCGCVGWQATQINTGVAAGRTFDDGSVLAAGKTVWNGTINVIWIRTK